MTNIYGQFGLLATTGIPVYTSGSDNDSDYELTVVPEFPETNPKIIASGNPATPQKRFEGAEHTFIGNAVTLQFPSGNITGADAAFPLDNGATLSYGQVLGLSGDFYGIPDNPICEGGVTAFQAAFDSLWNGDATELANILLVMNEEIQTVNSAVNEGNKGSEAYDSIGDYNSARWNLITMENPIADWKSLPSGMPSILYLPFLIRKGRYLELASNNLDHFGCNAMKAYQVGHHQAIMMALQAGQNQDETTLKKAYALNAFSDHFLTDLFAAGHLRVPREEMLDLSNDTFANLLVKTMHDEDNEWGLNVTNLNGDSWRCFGDGHFFDEVNSQNGNIIALAVQASANDIYSAYTNPSKYSSLIYSTPSAFKYIPNLTEVMDYNNTSNYAAMYVWKGGDVLERDPFWDKTSYDWTWWWTVWTAIPKILAMKLPGPPSNYLNPPPNSSDISYDSAQWRLNTPQGSNWVSGNQVRYAISYVNAEMESNKGDWCAWIDIDKYAEPLLELPAYQYSSGAQGVTDYRIYRQFTVSGVIQEFGLIGETSINNNTFQDIYE